MNTQQSFGPLGDLIRKRRTDLGLGLAEIADACECSVQFISNIEHGRAPLPWDKVEKLAHCLKTDLEEIQGANLAVRSDFVSFVSTGARVSKSNTKLKASQKVSGAANLLAYTNKDPQLRTLIEQYQLANLASRKRFVKLALRMLGSKN